MKVLQVLCVLTKRPQQDTTLQPTSEIRILQRRRQSHVQNLLLLVKLFKLCLRLRALQGPNDLTTQLSQA